MVDFNACFATNGDVIEFLLINGGILLYILLGLLAYQIFKQFDGDLDMNLVGAAFWPISLIAVIIYWIGRAIALPFIAATKRDVKEVKDDLSAKINAINIPTRRTETKANRTKTINKLKVGDLITGVKGNPGGYKHLYEGCICRVLSIDEKGQMNVMLIGHKDKEAHKDVIGKEFNAPARNFIKANRTR